MEGGIPAANKREFLKQSLNHAAVLYFHPKLEGPDDNLRNSSDYGSSNCSSIGESNATKAISAQCGDSSCGSYNPGEDAECDE